MNIVYAVPRYLPHLGGIENHVAALATGAHRAGHGTTVLTQAEGAAEPADEMVDGVRVRRFPSRLRARGQGLSPALWGAVRRLGPGADVLHVHNVHAASTLGILAAARPGRVVVTPHYLGTGTGMLDRGLHGLYDPVLGSVLGRASAVICVTRAEADRLSGDLHVPRTRVRVIPNGVDVAALEPSGPPDAEHPVVFVAGRLERYKQPGVVLDAMAHLPERYSLVIAGTGPEAQALRRAALASPAASRIHMVGRLEAAEMACWYRHAAVVVSMSRRECFGMTLAEGLAARCGVVASDIAPHREVLDDAGWDARTLLAPTASARQVAEAVVVAEAARRVATPTVTSWDDVVADTVALYEALSA